MDSKVHFIWHMTRNLLVKGDLDIHVCLINFKRGSCILCTNYRSIYMLSSTTRMASSPHVGTLRRTTWQNIFRASSQQWWKFLLVESGNHMNWRILSYLCISHLNPLIVLYLCINRHISQASHMTCQNFNLALIFKIIH